MTDQWRLDTLPSDVLLLIFDYCHAFDLVSLSGVCTRFCGIVRDDTLWNERRNRPLATNQASRRFRDRCQNLLCLRRRWQVSENWQSGTWSRMNVIQWKRKSMPWIKLHKDVIWYSNGELLDSYYRGGDDAVEVAEAMLMAPQMHRDDVKSDISKFVVRDDYVVAGYSDGSITFFTKILDSKFPKYANLSIINAHAAKVTSVDEVPGAAISGSGDGTVKLWRQPRESGVAEPLSTIDVLDRVWSLAADPTGSMFAVGSSGNTGVPPFRLFDIECCSESIAIRHPWRRGAGILDIVWEDPNVVLTCGYETTVQKWDTRIGSCVATWVDPTDSALYCISTDYRFTMVTGSQYNSKAVLWDQRMPTYVQLFFINVGRESSPVYGIAFDSSNLYAATDRKVVELKFHSNGRRLKRHDYRNIFQTGYSTPIAQSAKR